MLRAHHVDTILHCNATFSCVAPESHPAVLVKVPCLFSFDLLKKISKFNWGGGPPPLAPLLPGILDPHTYMYQPPALKGPPPAMLCPPGRDRARQADSLISLEKSGGGQYEGLPGTVW